ncbi:MAG: hypothetical protein KA114_06565 [Bacteroidales bacterium]|nr:hypothetical protein [Bacteroidales bacterium]
MNEKKLMDQISAIFGIFMTFFYIGVGLFLIMAKNIYNIDPVLRKIVGFSFLFYSLYRGYKTYLKIKEAFFP